MGNVQKVLFDDRVGEHVSLILYLPLSGWLGEARINIKPHKEVKVRKARKINLSYILNMLQRYRRKTSIGAQI